MNILHVTKKYPDALGGDAVVVSNLEICQKKLGHKVTILTSNCDEIRSGETIYKFGLKDTPADLDRITPKRLISLLILFFKAFTIIKQVKPDVIHTHSIDMAFFMSFAARYYKVPIVHTFHVVTFNDPRQQGIRSKIELWFLRGAKPSKIFVLNPGDIKDFNKAGFLNVIFVPNGVDSKLWQSKDRTKNKTFTYIAVGRLEEQKGFEDLVNAAAILSKKHGDFQVQIVGEGSKQPSLEALIEANNSNVSLLGRKSASELKALYAKADVFVLSSHWEGMPLTLLEAWAAGLPTVATMVNSIPYIAKEVSLLCEPGDPDSLAEAMEVMLSSGSKLAAYRSKSLASVKAFTWEAVAKQLLKQYV